MRHSTEPSRRDVLKQSAAAGLVGLTGYAGTVSARGEFDGETTELVVVERGDDPALTTTVPVPWMEHLRSVRRVAEQVATSYGARDEVTHVGYTRGTGSIGGLSRLAVEVEVDDADLGRRLAGESNGVGVRSVPAEPVEFTGLGSDTCATVSGKEETESSIPGGVTVGTLGDSGSIGTTTCAARKNGTDYLLTCGHILFDGNVCDGFGSQNYSELYHSTGSSSEQHIGTVADTGSAAYDYALAEATEDITDVSLSIDGDSGTVSGHVSKDGFMYLEANNETIYRSAQKTGTSSGTLTKVSYDGPITWDDGNCSRYHRFETDFGVIKGDSGGPFYYPYYDAGYLKLAIAGLQSTGKNPVYNRYCTEYGASVGVRADDLYNDEGIYFYGGSFDGF